MSLLLMASMGLLFGCIAGGATPKYSVKTTSSYLERISVSGIEFGKANIPVGNMGNTGAAVSSPFVPIPKKATIHWSVGKKGQRRKFSQTVVIPPRPVLQGDQNAYDINFNIRGDDDVLVEVVPKHVYLIQR